MRLEQARELIDAQMEITSTTEGQWCLWAIALKTTPQLIGYVELIVHSLKWGQAEIGWALHAAYRGRGYATAATCRMIAFGFDDLGMHRLYAECDPRNKPSVRMMERLRTRREAHSRDVIYVKGAWRDRFVYTMLAQEWDRIGEESISIERAQCHRTLEEPGPPAQG